ncbi:MAG TPA: tetratricopeptide repeat protein, partial [Flavobacterium sp.]|nr:tetratricopeptide repeat protein [Flavobacterium sp.]
LLIALGYNYQLLKDAKSKKYYDQAIDRLRANPAEVYAVAQVFERRGLLEYALNSYKLANDLQPGRYHLNYQIAVLYGQMGQIDMMVSTFLDEAHANPGSLIMVQNQLSRFGQDDEDGRFAEVLRKALLLKAQKSQQDVFWNQFLSWFYIQQKEYNKAFVQEKAIYRRNPESFSNIVNLAQLAVQEGDKETGREILAFVLENTRDLETVIDAHFYLLDMRIDDARPQDYPAIEAEFSRLINEFGATNYTLNLQELQAHFLAFYLNKPEPAKAILKNLMAQPLGRHQVAQLKMELADILLFEEKFNQALIYYSQIEEDLKNDVIGHQASLASARTSYFKGDFDWAQKQFQTLKSASSQLIANDALEYFLLINDNASDSTRTALKKFARADYLSFQQKPDLALQAFENILNEHKGDEIEAVTLLRIGRLQEKAGNFDKALAHYAQILEKHADGIYVDEALFYQAELYSKKLDQPEKAKPLYEQIIFKHEDSIHAVEARKRFRQLRGDNAS